MFWGAKPKGKINKAHKRDISLQREIAFFFMRKNGNFSVRDIQMLHRRLHRMECPVEKETLSRLIHDFSLQIDESPCHLFCCGGKACRKKSPVKLTEKRLAQLAEKLQCGISVTPCQGICEEAFVATLKVGQDYRMMIRLHRKKHWKALSTLAAI